ncbi:MAG TPA: DUF5916 domain-containing protein, partial [Rhodanobacteraceae bacterium]|nr:DUF5916 domain-containing protein [Rhodanobacteraceae bacterium]
STFSGSDIAQRGARTRGYGATALVDYDMGRGWRQQWALMHFDDRFQINDFGYLSRNNLDYLHWELRKRITDLAPDSRYSSHDWRLRVDALDNDHGLRLRRELRLQRESELRNGGDESLRINVDSAAWDDLLTRGHGALWLPSSFSASYSHSRPRQGDWGFEWEAELNAGGLAGVHRIGWEVGVEPTYFLSDALRLRAELEYGYTPSWLVWQTDNSVGEFARRSLELEAGFDWSIDQRQELRFKLQAIGLDAAVTGAWRVGSDGRAQAAADVIEDFSVRNLGLQVRYRYQLAPLSWLYVVYGRGGYDQDARSDEPGRLLDDALRLRDDEQLLVKLNYRFDI